MTALPTRDYTTRCTGLTRFANEREREREKSHRQVLNNENLNTKNMVFTTLKTLEKKLLKLVQKAIK